MPTDSVQHYFFEGFHLDTVSRRLIDPDGQQLHLSTRAFDTLHLLVKHPGEPVSKAEIINTVWSGMVVEDNNLNQAIFTLRKVLGDTTQNSRFILTVPGRGYSFIGELDLQQSPVEQEEDETKPMTPPLADIPPVPDDRQPAVAVADQRWRTWATVLMASCAAFLIVLVSLNFVPRSGENPVVAADGQGAGTAMGGESAPSPMADSVAVMPFSIQSQDEIDEFFSSGLHYLIISQLTRIDTLKVISRQQVMALGEAGKESPESIGATLGVESILAGNVTHHDDRIRVSLELADTRTGLNLWAGNYDIEAESETDLLALQHDIAVNVAGALEAEFSSSGQEGADTGETPSFDAYRFTLAARRAYDNFEMNKAWELSRKALDIDPDYTDALHLYARSNAFLSANPMPGMTVGEHLNEQLSSAEKLFALEPEQVRSYKTKVIAFMTLGMWSSIPPFVEVLNHVSEEELSPDSYIGMFYLVTGKFDEAITVYQTRMRDNPMSLNSLALQAAAFEVIGQEERANENLALGDELGSDWFGNDVRTLIQLGRGEDLTGVDKLSVSPETKHLLNYAHDKQYVREKLLEYRGWENIRPSDALFYSALSAHTGESVLSTRFLERATSQLSTTLFWAWLPLYDDTRRTPEFSALLEKSGLIRYWDRYGYPDMCIQGRDRVSCHPRQVHSP